MWFSFLMACGILAHWPGIEPVHSALEGEVLTTVPSGKSLESLFWLDEFDYPFCVRLHFPPFCAFKSCVLSHFIHKALPAVSHSWSPQPQARLRPLILWKPLVNSPIPLWPSQSLSISTYPVFSNWIDNHFALVLQVLYIFVFCILTRTINFLRGKKSYFLVLYIFSLCSHS